MKLTKPICIIILLLLPLVFLCNLGLPAFIDDEGNRALVALEMAWSGNWVTPTHHGAYYYNKPPLWNWILAFSFWLHGGASEWASRLPTVLSLFAFGGMVYWTLRKELGKVKAALAAFFVLSCGRIILWESLLGLIDIFFSLIIYGLLWVVYYFEQRQRWWPLFLISYTFMTLGYLLKGLPAIAFQGITLVAWLGYRGHWRKLFGLAHIGSGLLSLAILAGYYAIYHQYNDLGLVFETLLSESSKRTAAAHSIGDTLSHLFKFPIELAYHFLPWSLLSVLLLSKVNRQRVWATPFGRYAVIIGIANIMLYWLSPNFYPRYILMLVPLYFVVLLIAYPEQLDGWPRILLRSFGYLLFLLAFVAATASYFVKDTQFIPYLGIKVGFVALCILVAAWYYYRHPSQILPMMVMIMLLFRLGFDLFVLPARASHSSTQERRASVIAFAERWQDRTDLAIFYNSSMEMASSYYLSQVQNRIIPRRSLHELNMKEFYIFNPEEYDPTLFVNRIDSFIARHNYQDYFYVGQLRSTDSLFIEDYRQRDLLGY